MSWQYLEILLRRRFSPRANALPASVERPRREGATVCCQGRFGLVDIVR